ncbi:MAG: cobalamin biosynthesis protein CbiX [Firmicutes bacterium HGW-Firmicutes-13]|nr:MAG: cobalamin biosynthesis protein CbiX [Firmicutes bacterium HGW-Firmicutes-13]
MNSGIILLAHGSRRETANDVLTQLANMVQDDLNSDKVSRAFLQFSTPGLEEALREQVEAGIKEITVVPVFLFNGIHLEEDIPQLLNSERDKYPEVKIIFAEPIGADRRIGEIIKDRIKEVREGEGVSGNHPGTS